MQIVALAVFAAVASIVSAMPSVLPRASPWPPLKLPSKLTKAQQVSFQSSIVALAEDPIYQDKLVSDVKAAAAAAVGISQNFTSIGKTLLTIDGLGYGSNFSPQWDAYRKRYITILTQSKNQASSVSQYAADFETFLDLITNKDYGLTPADKIQLMEGFASESDTFRDKSDALHDQFFSLASDLKVFTGSFANFATKYLAQDNQQILELKAELAKVQGELDAVTKSMIALGALAGTVLGLSAAGLVFLPEFAPAIIIGAAIAEGLIIGTEIGLAVTYAVDQGKIADINGEINKLEGDINIISGANATLTDLAQNDVPSLANHIDLFTAVWSGVANDAQDIAQWVRDGEYTANLSTPISILVYYNKTATQYTSMVQALTLYATDVVIPKA